MPLHDWALLPGWDGVHQVWTVELLYWIKPRLPAGYRAYIGTTPTFAIGGPVEERPDVGVRGQQTAESGLPTVARPAAKGSGEAGDEPDEEVAVATLSGNTALLIEHHDRLVAAVKLISPRNRDRSSACAAYGDAYGGCGSIGFDAQLTQLGCQSLSALALGLGLLHQLLMSAEGLTIGSDDSQIVWSLTRLKPDC